MKNIWIWYKHAKLKAPSDVMGYAELTEEDRELFSRYLNNFYNAWEYPEEHIPVKVKRVHDKEDGNYLRVDFKNKEWYHVKNPETWY